MVSKYRYGIGYEYQIKKRYEKLGMYVVRSAGSKGLFDLIAFNNKEIYLICCRRREWPKNDREYVLRSVVRPENAYIIFFSLIYGVEKHYIYNHKNILLNTNY